MLKKQQKNKFIFRKAEFLLAVSVNYVILHGIFAKNNCGSSSVDRALAFQAKGRGFESRLPLTV